tara:strand:+ start:2174 stop:2836 length:663 start_codon:yes stop_codon:yes gene_type:complete
MEINRTTINNINNINDNKQQVITTSLNDTSVEQGLRPLVEDQQLGEKVSPKASLPFGLKSIKVDLFDNEQDVYSDKRKFKIALGLIKQDTTKHKFMAAMNSPIRNYKRNVENKNSIHYQLVKQIVDEWGDRVDNIRVSKFYESTGGYNKKSMQDASCIMWDRPQGYQVIVVLLDKTIDIELVSGKGVSTEQQKKGCIATWYKVAGPNVVYEPSYISDILK